MGKEMKQPIAGVQLLLLILLSSAVKIEAGSQKLLMIPLILEIAENHSGFEEASPLPPSQYLE